MAADTTTTLSEFISAAIGKAADDQIAEHLFFPGAPASKWIKWRDLTATQAVAGTFPKYGTLTAANLKEGDDYATTQALDPSATTITATEHGVQSVVTDMAWKAIVDPNGKAAFAEDVARNHVRAIMTKVDTDIMALFDNLDSGVTNTGVDLTNAHILYVVDLCEKANMPKPWAGFLHPQQWYDLVTEANGPWASAAASGSYAEEMYGTYHVGKFYGVDWFVSTNVPTANAGADRGGAIISTEAIGGVWVTMPTTTVEHDQSLRGDEVLTVARYGVAEIDGTMGMYIISDA